ncbi:MAG TPA: histidinol dehydrogenase [Mycobacteriales bacterium]|nr:histidinol dehydrogenase [Mycobacteriales bacterium]
MLRRIDLRSTDDSSPLSAVLPRAAVDVASVSHQVQPVLDAVRTRGAAAIAELSQEHDGVVPPHLRVPAEALADAVAVLDPAVQAGLEESIRRARIVHDAQRPVDVPVQVVPGGVVTERSVPVRRVGLYVPGGLAVYPSSVVMNVVPAQVAGVPSIALASPPQKEYGGLPHPTILAAAALLGIDEVYAVGGAQAVAMFAYGIADTVEPVDLVTGPGNVYVAAAKRLLRGVIGIDSEAGPTEIAVLADDSADPAYVAADLISQAEHDTLAASVLVTDSEALADAVGRQLGTQTQATKHVERITAALSGEQSGVVLVRDLEQGLAVVNAYAAEHLEVLTRDAAAVAARVVNAGAIFVGPYSPVALGDYCAGSNHVLPTGGTARHSSGLSVQTFCRGIHVIEYDEQALAGVSDHIAAVAYVEDLPAHAAAVQVRAATAQDVPMDNAS